MYRHCIYCSAELGANEALEAFPVGRTLAFDGAKGRLWAVCAKCGRWNLAPIEERWEAIEDAEKLFRDTRTRVQSENVGLAKLRDGTRLIRVGAALQGELAAWRYGEQLVKRRQRHLLVGGAFVAAAAVGLIGAGYAVIGFSTLSTIYHAFRVGTNEYRGRRPVYTMAGHESPDGIPVSIQRKHLLDVSLRRAEVGGIELHLPARYEWQSLRIKPRLVRAAVALPDRHARRVLERGMVYLNSRGARRTQLEQALRRISTAGSAEEYILGTASSGLKLESEDTAARMPPDTALALEIALHEEQERRALAGELAILESAWHDAERIAALADRLAIEGS